MGIKETIEDFVGRYKLSAFALIVVLALVVMVLAATREGMEIVPGGLRSGNQQFPTNLKFYGTRDDTGFGGAGGLTPMEQWGMDGEPAKDGFIGRDMPMSAYWPPIASFADYRAQEGQVLTDGTLRKPDGTMEGSLSNQLLAQ